MLPLLRGDRGWRVGVGGQVTSRCAFRQMGAGLSGRFLYQDYFRSVRTWDLYCCSAARPCGEQCTTSRSGKGGLTFPTLGSVSVVTGAKGASTFCLFQASILPLECQWYAQVTPFDAGHSSYLGPGGHLSLDVTADQWYTPMTRSWQEAFWVGLYPC